MPLLLTVNGKNGWDPVKEEFITIKTVKVKLEHCLLSISKWEALYKKPFLTDAKKTKGELLDYIRCMVLEPEDVDPNFVLGLTPTQLQEIGTYMNTVFSATVITNRGGNNSGGGEYLSSELIYYYMAQTQIPYTAETWHLSRLVKLLEIAAIKSQPEEKMSPAQIAAQNRALNASRRQAAKSKARAKMGRH
jgi:hypothetical protein